MHAHHQIFLFVYLELPNLSLVGWIKQRFRKLHAKWDSACLHRRCALISISLQRTRHLDRAAATHLASLLEYFILAPKHRLLLRLVLCLNTAFIIRILYPNKPTYVETEKDQSVSMFACRPYTHTQGDNQRTGVRRRSALSLRAQNRIDAIVSLRTREAIGACPGCCNLERAYC